MFFKNSKTALELKKFKQLEDMFKNETSVSESEPDVEVQPSPMETVYADIDSDPHKRVVISHTVLKSDNAGFELLVLCNDGSLWIYKHGPKSKWTQLPNVPQGK